MPAVLLFACIPLFQDNRRFQTTPRMLLKSHLKEMHLQERERSDSVVECLT